MTRRSYNSLVQWTVILKRGPLPDLTYGDIGLDAARRRAAGLAAQHGAPAPLEDPGSRTITVDGSSIHTTMAVCSTLPITTKRSRK